MKLKMFLARLGFGAKSERKSPITMERERFEAEVKDQFKKLKDKGLSIPVFTLWRKKKASLPLDLCWPTSSNAF